MLSHRTDGKVIFASGSPYFPVTHKDVTYEPGQGNNMYIFPGLGLGAILSKARHVSDAMVEQASIALASSLTEEEKAAQLVYPRLTRIRDISAQVAFSVIRQAQREVSVGVGWSKHMTDAPIGPGHEWLPSHSPRRYPLGPRSRQDVAAACRAYPTAVRVWAPSFGGGCLLSICIFLLYFA